MQDTVIKGNGRSYNIKAPADMPATYDEWRAQAMAGNAQLDVTVNPDTTESGGISQLGTPLNKKNLLTDETATLLGVQSDATIDRAFNSLFMFASNGKKKCAEAVTGMGVPTANNATFDTIAANIKKIETGPDVSQLTATPAQVRAGYKFIGSAGTVETGTIMYRGYTGYYPSATNQTIEAGLYLSGTQTFYGLDLSKVVVTNSEYGNTSSNYNAYRKITVDYRNVGTMSQIRDKADMGFLMVHFRDGDRSTSDPLLLVLHNGVGNLYTMYGSNASASSTFRIYSFSYGGGGASTTNMFTLTLYDPNCIFNGSGTSTSGYVDNFVWVPKSIFP